MKYEPINFTQSKNTVTADRRMVHVLYTRNKDIAESLGGKVLKNEPVFTAEFAKARDAKKFLKQACTQVSEEEYQASRKPKTEGKGNAKAVECVTVHDDKGNTYTVAKSSLTQVSEDKPAPTRKKESKQKDKGASKPKNTHNGKGEAKAKWQTEIDAFAGKGRSANHDVADILRKHHMSTQIGSEGWSYWESVR